MTHASAPSPDPDDRPQRPAVVHIAPENEIFEFASESESPAAPPQPQIVASQFESELPSAPVPEPAPIPATHVPAATPLWQQPAVVIGGGLAALAVVAMAAWAAFSGGGASANGSLRVESDPAGIAVSIDGAARGTTPLTLGLAAGRYTLALEHNGRTQTIPVTIAARAETIHHITWSEQPAAPAVATPAATVGALQIQTEPAAALVEVDGVARGSSPVSLTGLTPGDHQVVVRSGGAVTRRTVRIDAGATASLVISSTPPAAVSGWLETTAAIPLQILEGGRLIGTTDTARVMLPVGRHELEFAADAYGFRSRRTVDVGPARTTTLTIALDRVPLSVNATPWAEVWIDGTRAGETPMAAVMTTVGPHEIEFRHPELGRKVVPMRVSLREPARISVDMRTP